MSVVRPEKSKAEMEQAFEQMVHVAQTYTPNSANKAVYERKFAVHKKAVE